MKAIGYFALFVLAAANIQYYTVKDEDIEAVVANITILQSYVDCLLDRTPCSETLIRYKRVTPECVQNACLRCTPLQKKRYWQFLEGVRLLLPEEYDNYRKYYDPDNKYFDALIKELSKYKTLNISLSS